MKATDYGFMEVLTVKPHWEAAKTASSSYFSKKYFDRYCAMATLFYSFPPDEWRRISPTQTLSLMYLENDSRVLETGIETRFPYF